MSSCPGCQELPAPPTTDHGWVLRLAPKNPARAGVRCKVLHLHKGGQVMQGRGWGPGGSARTVPET